MPNYVKRYTKKAYKKVYGSRKIPGAIKKTGEVAKDIAGLTASVAMIMGRLNVEKNYVDTDVVTRATGQVEGNGDGATVQDLLPAISQGDGQGNRHGNSIKATGISCQLQFASMANTQGARKIRVSLLKVRSADNNVTQQEAFQHYFDVNPLSGVRDYNCPRNYRSGTHDGITCVRSQTYYLKAPTVLSGNVDNEAGILTTKFNVKLNDVLRYDVNGDTLPTGMKYVLCVQMDAGNNSGGSASTLDVPIKVVNSGADCRISTRFWYVDN